MIKALLLFSGIALFGTYTFSQGFLGYRQVFSAGIGLSPSGLFNEPGINHNPDYFLKSPASFKSFYDKSYFLPRLNINYGINVGSHLQFNVSLGSRPLRNAGMQFRSTGTEGNTTVNYSDDFRVSYDAVEARGEFRLYDAFAPVGNYCFIGGNTTFTGSTITASYTTSYNDYTVTEEKPEAYLKKVFFGVSAGIGKTALINRKYFLDYGARFNCYLSPYILKNVVLLDFKLPDNGRTEADFNTFLEATTAVNLQNYNTLEIYLRYGIMW